MRGLVFRVWVGVGVGMIGLVIRVGVGVGVGMRGLVIWVGVAVAVAFEVAVGVDTTVVLIKRTWL